MKCKHEFKCITECNYCESTCKEVVKELVSQVAKYENALKCAYRVLDNPRIGMGDRRKLVMGDITEALVETLTEQRGEI